MTHRLTLLALAALMAAAPAWAQTKKELVARVVALQQADYEAIGRGVAGQPAQQLLAAAGQALNQLPPERREAVGKEIQAEVRKFYDGIAPVLVERAGKAGQAIAPAMLEEKFSEDELKLVIAFLESPASKKYSEIGGQLPGRISERVVSETRATVEPKLKALEQTVMAKLKAAAAAGPAASAPAPKPAASGARK
ncbi:hypothetical protein [Ideonella alba]|uniref:DUF2059 domain-containing protein n=1 Tax=Ideonella alba TaxID=2824118 RepID=A0A940YGF4_9BURK|nr:hypothetical protein [Ideonella alba]MBQ0932861.1 hypothetical protein [Ideonella alba]